MPVKPIRPVAIVTGGSHGIGRAVANRLSADGLRVLNADIEKPDRTTLAEWIAADVSREADIRRTVARALRDGGRLDIVVSNAGVLEMEAGFDSKSWHHILAVNLTAAFFFAKYAAPHLKKTRGSIVTIASTRAMMSEPNTQAYSASKGGLVSLTHSLAMSLAPEVRVNCISPGWIDTQNERLRPIDHRQHPVGRVGRPEDIAALTAFLVSPAAENITGQNFVCDGGMTKKMIYAP